ncbi:MAG: hypothetical protein LC640_04460 [Frankia sp.]|nr:hypothetical protein [Frankia sp.]
MLRVAATAAVACALTAAPAVTAAPPPGFASSNVEWLANVPLHADTAGARLVGKRLFIADSRSLTVYDVSQPELPKPVGAFGLPEVPYYPQEDVDTDGRILILGQGSPNPTGLLWVFDVTAEQPQLLATLQGASSHTVSCVLRCTWVYNSNGTITDLREPARPHIAGDWRKGTGVTTAHDVTEVSPGVVVTSSNPMLLLDARANPAQPRLVARGRMPDKRFVHANLWPNAARDRLLLVGGETEGGNCSDRSAGAFATFDASRWRRTGTLRFLDEYRAPDTLPTAGGFPVATWCSHWFTPRPGYRNGGMVAAGWYEHGTRLLNVAGNGKIREAGWFIPAGTTASQAYWVTRDILYVLDYNRGLDVIRIHDGAVRRGESRPRVVRGLAPWQAPLRRVALRPSYSGLQCPVPVPAAR